jgi:hypothetical protein
MAAAEGSTVLKGAREEVKGGSVDAANAPLAENTAMIDVYFILAIS